MVKFRQDLSKNRMERRDIFATDMANWPKRTGMLTGRPGTVYDVNIKYPFGGGYKAYVKKGFTNKKDALQHEAEMKVKLSNPSYIPTTATQGTTVYST